MLKIAFFTTTRAEFGIMSSFIKEIGNNPFFETFIFVGGTHLKKEFGSTINEITEMGIYVSDTFDYLKHGSSNYDLSVSAGQCGVEVSRIFQKYDFDVISILGDRYELIPIALTSIIFNIPIIHWGGGEFTEGVIDNQIRQMLTKAAHIHFVAAQNYADNIIKLGEKQEMVCITGSPVVENFKKTKPIPKSVLFQDLGLTLEKKVILLTYHPVSIEMEIAPLEQITNLFDALKTFDFQVVITAPNLESDRQVITDFIEYEVAVNENFFYFDSLGIMRYHSLIPHCSFLIGNSSSGIFEAPFFRTPTIDIGDRQKGRFMHNSIINTSYETSSIKEAIEKVLTSDFQENIKSMKYEFGDGKATKIAIEFLKSLKIDEKLIRKT